MPRNAENSFSPWSNPDDGADAEALLGEATSALDDSEDAAAIRARMGHPGLAADTLKIDTQAAPDTPSVEEHQDAHPYSPDFADKTPHDRGLEEGPQG